MFWTKASNLASLLLLLNPVTALDLNVDSPDSIRNAASTIAKGLGSYYHNDDAASPDEVGVLGQGYYWWEAGAMWGALVDYWAYTGDETYVQKTINALVAQGGSKRDLLNPKYFSSTGNDDQAFWALAMMSALEHKFPTPQGQDSFYLDTVVNVFNQQASRWNQAGCDGGLLWQFFDYNPGQGYMNTVSNGCFFQLGARLARFTGNSTYAEWAEKAYDWSAQKGLIDSFYSVFDGTDANRGCSDINHLQWTYNNGLFMYGSAVMHSVTSDQKWQDRTNGFVTAASVFFSPYDNATNIMSEVACESIGTCNTDQQSFKAYLSRWMAKTTVVMASTREAIFTLLRTSAQAAAGSCSGGSDGVTCGTKWYVGGWDGTFGVGQQLTALETIQGLLVDNAGQPVSSEPESIPEPPPTPTSQIPVPSKTSEVETLFSTTTLAPPSSTQVTRPTTSAAATTSTSTMIDAPQPTEAPAPQETDEPGAGMRLRIDLSMAMGGLMAAFII